MSNWSNHGNGADEANGANGASGANGTNGANGANGTNEANGANGANETNKASGTNGTNKPNDAYGASGQGRPPLEPKPFLPKKGNYRDLLVYKKSECIYDVTYYFAHHYFVERKDRTIDQVVQAARSGKQNIIEGCSAASTSSPSV